MSRNSHSVLLRGQPASLKSAPPGAIVLQRWKDDASGPVVGLNYCCPCGCGAWGWLPFKEYEEVSGFKDVAWSRTDDNWSKLTLTPSIGFMPQKAGGYHWHGYLRSGVFEEC